MKFSVYCLGSLVTIVQLTTASDIKARQLQLRGKPDKQPPSGVRLGTDNLADETIDQSSTARSKNFDAIDVNGDGHILLWEYLKTTCDEERLATYKFECSDANLDGRIDLDEYTYIQTHMREMDDCLGSMIAFKMIDKNHDGHLTQKEMWKTVGSMRFDQRWAFMIACSDPNQDGKVSPLEFSHEIYDCVEVKVKAANEDFVDFNKSDKDSNGCVDDKEMAAALNGLLGHDLITKGRVHYGDGNQSVQHLAIGWITCADDNHDHCLQAAEYEHLLDPDDEQAYCLGTTFEFYEYDMDFMIMDSNGDGKVSKQEYYTWVDRIAMEVQHEEADAMFHAADLNQDNFLDEDEFHQAGAAYEGDGPDALFLHTFAPDRVNRTQHSINLKKNKKSIKVPR